MFYQGDLQSGIALAVREAKSVVCFVRDDQDESAKWENEYFEDDISQLLSDKSVTLRLTAGTQEAGFLTSICPIQAFPAVLVIMNGVVQEYIAAGTSKEDFQTRLRAAVDNRNTQQPPSHQAATTYTETTSDTNQQPPVAPSVPVEPASQPRPVTNEQRPMETTQPVRQPTQQDQKEKDRRALQLKLQREKREQNEERERIRNQIKQDQEARKQRSAEERNRSLAAAAEAQGNSSAPAAASARKVVSEYRLQVRLFDGTSVRASFPLSATIRKDIRPWLEGHRGDDSQPYNLKHILTPLPNHTMSASEEERALEEIGLGPTASLVMVPVPSYIEAYASPSLADSLPGRAVSAGYGLVSGVVGGAAGLVGSFLGYGVRAAAEVSASASARTSSDNSTQPPAASSRPTPRTGGAGINVRTLRDQREEQDRNEFYNGNTLNFEPKKNDDHKND